MLNMPIPIDCKFRVYPVELKSFKMGDCLISESIEVYNYENFKEYDPFDNYNNSSDNLYLRFISLNRNSQEIFEFIKEYGFLNTPNTSLISYGKRDEIFEEAIYDISFQINRMRFISEIAHRNKNTTADELYQLIINAFMYFSDDNFSIGRDFIDKKYLLEGNFLLSKATYEIKAHYASITNPDYKGKCDIAFFKEQFKDIFGENIALLNLVADNILVTAINREIRDVYSYLSMPSPGKREYIAKTKTPTLLSALYTMLYFDITQNKVVKKCANPKCNAYFEISYLRSDKKYCSNNCAQIIASKKYRIKEKDKREKEKKRLEELSNLELFQADSE